VSVPGSIIERMEETRGWLPEDLVLMPPGPQLAAVLAGVDRARLSDEDLVRLAQARHRLNAHLQAQLLADLHAIGARSDEAVGRPVDSDARRWAEVEIAFALTWTSRAASGQLGLADDLIDRLPAVFAALDAGEVDIPKARVLCDAVIGLDTPTARRVVDQVIGEAHRLTTGQLRARLQRLVLAADPDAVKRAAASKLPGRRVQARLTDDGLAELSGYDLPPHRVAAAMERLTAIARAAKSDGDTRRLDQLRADILLDLVVGDGVGAGGPITTSSIGDPDAAGEPTTAPQPRPSQPSGQATTPTAATAPSDEDPPRDAPQPQPTSASASASASVNGGDAVHPDVAESAHTPDPAEESESDSVEGDDAVDPAEAELADAPDPAEESESESVEGDDAVDPAEAEVADAPDPAEEPPPVDDHYRVDPVEAGLADLPDPVEEPPSVEGDDGGDLDAEELAGLWSAGFDQLPTSRPQPHDNTDGRRAAMPAPRRGVIDIQVPLTTLLRLADFPGDLAGFGPVIADIARQVVAEQADATWRFSVYDPLGELISHGITHRRPTASDTAFIKARDRTCRAPGCRMAARHCDVDHTDEWTSSKDSRRCNLACLCRKHHLFKHLTGSDLIQIRPGILGWTTPLGQRYVTRPEPHPDELSLLRPKARGDDRCLLGA
jgi:hypothetical protein